MCSDNINNSTPEVEFLKQQPDVTLEWYAFDPKEATLGTVKRFGLAADPTIDAFIVRDLDSRLSLRERYGMFSLRSQAYYRSFFSKKAHLLHHSYSIYTTCSILP